MSDIEDDHNLDDEEDLQEAPTADIPGELKGLRACKRCALVKSIEQFYGGGCENCDFLRMKEDPERVNDCTSAYYGGLVALTDPGESWVAKWYMMANCKPGLYAVEVVGEFPKDIEDFLRDEGLSWRCKPSD